MTANISGVIIEFKSKEQQGVILLRHRDAPSLDFVIDEYLNDNLSHPLWLAAFGWDQVDAVSRAKTQHEMERLQRRFKKRHLMRRVIVGRIVRCAVVRRRMGRIGRWRPTWEATQVTIGFDEPQHLLAGRHGLRRGPGTKRVDRRIYQKNLGTPDNIRRPWRG